MQDLASLMRKGRTFLIPGAKKDDPDLQWMPLFISHTDLHVVLSLWLSLLTHKVSKSPKSETNFWKECIKPHTDISLTTFYNKSCNLNGWLHNCVLPFVYGVQLAPQQSCICNLWYSTLCDFTSFFLMSTILPYSDKRKQLTNHPNLRKWCFLDWTWHVLLLFYEFWTGTLTLLRNNCVKTSWYCIDVNVHGRHSLLIYDKCHCLELLPFVRVRQYSLSLSKED